MQVLKILGIALLVLLTGFDPEAQTVKPADTFKWAISENSSLQVNGSTNVNKFTCNIPSYDRRDTLTVNKSAVKNQVALTGSMDLNVRSFDCHKKMMTKDLRKTLKANKYPRMIIRFLSLNELPELEAKPASISGQVEIEIAGKKKSYAVNYQISLDGEKNIHLLGSREVTFSDFNLVPPKKLGGLVKTKDQLNVEFQLHMKAVKNDKSNLTKL
jgi:hypothetical protein